MTIDLTSLVRPHVVEMTRQDDTPHAAEFRLQPLERGFGHTLGNALRRMLLSSLRGTAVWAFRLEGVVHEHQTVPGVVEDIHQIIQRLKNLTLVLDEEVEEAVLHLKVDKAGAVCAKDLELHGVERAPDGTPVVQGPDDPAPGYYVSTTALEDRTRAVTDPRRYVDSNEIPFVVLPYDQRGDARLGDFGVVVNRANGARPVAG